MDPRYPHRAGNQHSKIRVRKADDWFTSLLSGRGPRRLKVRVRRHLEGLKSLQAKGVRWKDLPPTARTWGVKPQDGIWQQQLAGYAWCSDKVGTMLPIPGTIPPLCYLINQQVLMYMRPWWWRWQWSWACNNTTSSRSARSNGYYRCGEDEWQSEGKGIT